MRYSRFVAAAMLVFGTSWAVPASAANKEQLQMMADLRMLQEQAQQLQVLIGSLSDALKAVNTRLDQQSETSRRSFAEQKLGSDNLLGDLRIVREKMDDNNIRIGSLTQEVDALRQSVQQLSALPPAMAVMPAAPEGGAAAAGAPGDPGADGTTPPPAPPPLPAAIAAGASPQRLFDSAYADYTAGQFDLAVQGFESYIKSFPRSERADDAQVYIGNSYLQAGKYENAVEAYDIAIRTYPTGNLIPDAWYKKGLALSDLKQTAQAIEAFEFVARTFPESSAAFLARQQLAQSPKP